MHYELEVLKDHYTPSQALLIQMNAKKEAREEGKRCTVSIDRKQSGIVEIEVKVYDDLNLIQPVRYG